MAHPTIRVLIETASGRTYLLDYAARRWERLAAATGAAISQCLPEHGRFSTVGRIELGAPVELDVPRTHESGRTDRITTAPVTRIVIEPVTSGAGKPEPAADYAVRVTGDRVFAETYEG